MCLVLLSDGPPAIDWALIHPERVAGPVLLNTYYWRHEDAGLRPPSRSHAELTPCRATAIAGVVLSRRIERHTTTPASSTSSRRRAIGPMSGTSSRV
jgi:hypothetical protein